MHVKTVTKHNKITKKNKIEPNFNIALFIDIVHFNSNTIYSSQIIKKKVK